LQWADAFDALFSEEERHTGAGGFVWSSAIEDDFAVAGETVVFMLELGGIHTKSAGNGFRVGFEVHGVAEVDDDQLFGGVEFYL
jgi:hypothetical protein